MIRRAFATWRYVEARGMASAVLMPLEQGFGAFPTIRAAAVEIHAGRSPRQLSMTIDLFDDWAPGIATIWVDSPRRTRSISLERSNGEWRVRGRRRRDLDGCVDIDVAATPLTNTFPIRRLARVGVGESRTVPVAWVEVPTLRVVRVEQTYTRLGPLHGVRGGQRWLYGDPVHGTRDITVDRDGLVIDYEGFAERVPRLPA